MKNREFVIFRRRFLVKDVLNTCFMIAALIVFYRVIGCPFVFLFGISCPGCGMTRAVISCCRFDFRTAFYYHPLVFSLPFAGILYLIRNKFRQKSRTLLLSLWLAAFFVVYCIRIGDPQSPLSADFTSGMIYKAYVWLRYSVLRP